MSRRIRIGFIAFLVILMGVWLGGCTEENPAVGVNNGSNNGANNGVDDAATTDDAASSDVEEGDDVEQTQDSQSSEDTDPVEDVIPGEDVTPPEDAEDTSGHDDTGTTADVSEDTGGDGDTADDDIVEDTGDPSSCATNSDCTGEQVCCENLETNVKSCYDRGDDSGECPSGGICETEAECAPGEGCCQIDPQLNENRCSTQCGGTSTGCTTNSDCSTAGDVCCLNRDGTTECRADDQCFGGGLCASDSDCEAGDECCPYDIQGTTYEFCSDRCFGN